MVVGGALGSVMGAYLAGLIPTLTLAIIFVIVSIITILGIYLDRIAPEFSKKNNPWFKKHYYRFILFKPDNRHARWEWRRSFSATPQSHAFLIFTRQSPLHYL